LTPARLSYDVGKEMKDWQTFLIGFGIFNLCLLIFCRSLSGLVLGFFSISRRILSPEEAERRATKMGFQGFFTNPEITKPSRKRAIQFLAWTGGINFLGCIAFYLFIASGFVNETRAEQDGTGQPPTRHEFE
jgi:hypothetical protein